MLLLMAIAYLNRPLANSDDESCLTMDSVYVQKYFIAASFLNTSPMTSVQEERIKYALQFLINESYLVVNIFDDLFLSIYFMVEIIRALMDKKNGLACVDDNMLFEYSPNLMENILSKLPVSKLFNVNHQTTTH
jgi:hypothetical protein